MLESRGLRVGAAGRVESRVAEGRVLTQMPRAGSRVEPGTRRRPRGRRAGAGHHAERGRTRPAGGGPPSQCGRLDAGSRPPGKNRANPRGRSSRKRPPRTSARGSGRRSTLVVAPRADGAGTGPDGVTSPTMPRALLAEADLRRGRVRQQESPAAYRDHPRPVPRRPRESRRRYRGRLRRRGTGHGPGAESAGPRRARRRCPTRQSGAPARGDQRRRSPGSRMGTVIDQEPGAGERAAVGSAVDLVVATPVTVRVPDLLGLDEAAVEDPAREQGARPPASSSARRRTGRRGRFWRRNRCRGLAWSSGPRSRSCWRCPRR